MSFWKLIKGIKYQQIASLSTFFFMHPVLMLATIKATSRTLKIVQEEFPDIHGKDNKANAFRHALWNFLIALACFRKEKNLEKVVFWTKEITDWHEDFSPNIALAREMDLHNNHVGRALFLKQKSTTEKEIIRELKLMLISAIQIESLNEINHHSFELVFINQD